MLEVILDPGLTGDGDGGDSPPSSSLPPISSPSPEKPRTKRWAPKTFNGCLTCKKRRIKCDESKPSCKRCIKSKIQCSGYAPPRIKLFDPNSSSSSSSSNAFSSSSSSSSTAIKATPRQTSAKVVSTRPAQHPPLDDADPHPGDMSLQPAFGTQDEYRSFQFFLEKTSDLISVYSQPYLWTVLLPQATWHQPAIRHSIIALASLHQSLTIAEPAATLANRNFIAHYNRAIRALVEDRPPVDVVLASCVIFWALENFNGSGQAAFDHMKGAINILGEWKARRRPNNPVNHLIEMYIEPTIRDGIKLASKDRVDELSDLMSALSLTSQDVRIINTHLPAFDSLESAADNLKECIGQILHLMAVSAAHANVVETINELDARLYKWMNMFQSLTATGPVYQRRMLIVHNVAAYILLDQLKAQAGFDMHEPHRCRLSFIVMEVEEILATDAEAQVASCQMDNFGLGFVAPMFLAACCAPTMATRQRAVSALRRLDGVEGAWSTNVAASVAEFVLEIVQESSVLRAEVVLRDMSLVCQDDPHVVYLQWQADDTPVQFWKQVPLDVDATEETLSQLVRHFGYHFTGDGPA